MRYDKADRLIELILEMQANRMGLTLDEIEQRFEVGRRTAQRMRDAVARIFPSLITEIDEERRRRWRIPGGVAVTLLDISPDELADLDSTAAWLRQERLEPYAATVTTVLSKLRASLTGELARRTEPDLEALLETEGLAMRPGPHPRTSPEILTTIRSAIKQARTVNIVYRPVAGDRLVRRTLEPYGVILGARHYLVACKPHAAVKSPHLYALPNILEVRVGRKPFVRDPGFSLQAFVKRSFGSFQEEPQDVVWQFSPKAAKEAGDYLFHPSQTLEPQVDGSLIVRFTAGGLREMCWHLFTWGDEVTVRAPKQLQNLVAAWRRPRVARSGRALVRKQKTH